ncbi:hypothetical protein [Bradyrhizobium sp. dw_78]|uniref:hypothetical protein n=1 Tax=Bradyrhizobium sp. dw_78 TaxID=2719793 RepID=UPI001BD400DA|nr:hypothetical protein [Bradyrhizobium sp. dw_78]
MRRIIVIAAAGFGLAGCSSFSMDMFKSTPPTVQVQLDSTPQGADAKTSLGPGCKTPCTVSVSPPDTGFSVTYSMDKFVPATVPVTVVHIPADFSTPASTNIDPNPVVAELQPAGPPPKASRRRAIRPRSPKPPTGAAPAPADGTFPDPGQSAPPPRQ